MPKKFYSQTPVVPAGKIAGTNPIHGPALGSATPSIVPAHEGVIHGLSEHHFGHPSVKGAHGYGHVAKLRQGHHRLSGHTGAHMLGMKVKAK